MHLEEQTPINIHLRHLSMGPSRSFKEWHTYYVNGYKFHTESWTEGKETINSGVCMKSVSDSGVVEDFYGIIEHIYEIDYTFLDYAKKVVLFYCKWFDPSSRGTKINLISNTVDIRMSKKYPRFDPFALAHNVRQVYYVPYPSTVRSKQGWCAAIKTRPTSGIEEVEAGQNEEVAFQMDEMSNLDHVIGDETISQLCHESHIGEEVDEQEIDELENDEGNDLIHSSNDDDDDDDDEDN